MMCTINIFGNLSKSQWTNICILCELVLKAHVMSSLCRSEQNLLVRDLEPNTKYEFAIRLHIDQLSSPWSPVVYQSTFPEGER